jgi:2-dehydro-3-deoxyphosphogluconate aldolase/(4S)-4-hydroxy-2-oxoglutarate aldolase
MDRSDIIKSVCEVGIVAVIRGETPEQAAKIADACVKAGIKALEITFTVPGAADVIKALKDRYKGTDVIVGAGTVLDPETARAAILAGAQFVVSPYLNVEMVKLCNRYEIPVMAGAMTPKEAIECMEAGSDLIKIFPGELFGPKIIKAFRGPLPQARMIPTGGVSLDNVGEWIKAGAVAVGVGGSLTSGAKTGDYAKITETGKQFIANIKAAREK